MRVFAGSFISLAASLLAAEPGFPIGIKLPDKARGEAAIAALGARLPEVAAFHGKSPQRLRQIFRADDTLWVDPSGDLFYACPPECADCAHADPTEEDIAAESIGPTDPGPFDTAEAFLLHSRPGANRVIYLDFTGHADASGKWKAGAESPPFDLDGNEANFNSSELNRIIGVWQRVAEDYAMYAIDVTTEDPGIEALRKTNSSDTAYGIRVVIGGSSSDWYGNGAGGVAFVGSFDANTDTPCWVFPKAPGCGIAEKNIAEATSHEAGHTLGLNHDGVEGGASYYGGQGNWAPIMGVSYNEPISQWSKGEYANPNNLQDDLAVMLTQGAVYRPDDHGGTTATSTQLTADASSVSVGGVIERNTDLDFLRINAASGSLVINAKPAPRGPNLRLQIKLYDAAGALLQTATATDTSDGTQPVTLTRTVTAGVHYISVEGIGNGDPLTTGYSDYASIGQYNATISGVVPGGFTWLLATSGTKQWNTAANWSAAIVPNSAGAIVRVNNDITGSQTIQLASATTLGSLYLGDSNSTHGFTLAPAGGSVVFNNSGNPANLSKTTGLNDVISVPVSLVGELVLTQSASGDLSFSGGISGTGSLTKSGAGTVVFGTSNSYTGATTLESGLLRLDNSAGMPGGIDNVVGAGEGALAFKGGVLGLATGNFTRQLGTAAGQLNWANGSGGFAAFGADREVRLNNGTASFSWASSIVGTGNTLILGHPSATHALDFKNGISLAGAERTILVDDGDASVDAVISGVLSDGNTASSLKKTGNGVLSLTNANTYGGSTTVADGVLLIQNAAALPAGNLKLTGGGVLGLGSGDLDFTAGTGVGQCQWTGSGGFAAYGANRAVDFNVTSINWSATNFIGGSRTLILGHETSDATLIWQQRISLSGSTRVVQVEDGSANIDAKMAAISGGSSGTSNALVKTGVGTLSFTGQNTHYGNTTISAGTVMIGDGGTGGGISQNSPNIIVESGATLAVNRSNTLTQGDNPLKVAITGEGGLLQTGTGITVLALANTYTGPTTIAAGTLALGAGGVIPDASAVLLGNATLDAATFTDTVGTLDATGASNIHLGAGAAIAFAHSAAIDWTGGTLDLTGTFVSGSSLRFGTNSSGLALGQLALISADGFTGFALNANGYLVANPAFSPWIAGNFTNGSIPIDQRGPHDDFDKDGVSNLMEFAIAGHDPTVANPPIGGFTGNTLSFTKRAGTSGLIYAIQQSTDLGANDPWNEVTGGSYVNDASTISHTLPVGGPAKIFLRLRVFSQ